MLSEENTVEGLSEMIEHNSEDGFSYIDVMIAIVILMVGCLALAAAITGAVVTARGGEAQLNAKQLATSSLESILSARDISPVVTGTTRFGWNNLGMTDGSLTAGANEPPKGLFEPGKRTVSELPGADNLIGTGDDAGNTLAGVQREIKITNVSDDGQARHIEVTIYYRVGGLERRESIATIISNYAVEE